MMIPKINKAKKTLAEKLAVQIISIIVTELKKNMGVTNIIIPKPKYVLSVDECQWRIKFTYFGMVTTIDPYLFVEMNYSQLRPKISTYEREWLEPKSKKSLDKVLQSMAKKIKQSVAELEEEDVTPTPEDKIFDMNIKNNKKIAKLATKARAALKWFNNNSYAEFQELIDGESTTDLVELVNSFGPPESKSEYNIAEKFGNHYLNLFDYLHQSKQINKQEYDNYTSAQLYLD